MAVSPISTVSCSWVCIFFVCLFIFLFCDSLQTFLVFLSIYFTYLPCCVSTAHTGSEVEHSDQYTQSVNSLHSSHSSSTPAALCHHGNSLRARRSSQVANYKWVCRSSYHGNRSTNKTKWMSPLWDYWLGLKATLLLCISAERSVTGRVKAVTSCHCCKNWWVKIGQ